MTVVNSAADQVDGLIVLVNTFDLSTSLEAALENKLTEGSDRLMGSVAPRAANGLAVGCD